MMVRHGLRRLLIPVLALLLGLELSGSPAQAASELDYMIQDLRCAKLTISLMGRGSCPAEERSILIAGSISMLRYTRELRQAFEKQYPDLKVSYGAGNSISSLLALNRRAIDMAAVARDLNGKEFSLDIRAVMVGRDGMAIIVHPSNPLTSLSAADMEKLFTGAITDWSALSPQIKGPVQVVSRQGDSATRQSFIELALDGEDITPAAVIKAEGSEVVSTVASHPLAIGYVALHDVGAGVKALAINGVPMTTATLLSGRYELSRPLYYVTKGAPSPLVQRFLDFAVSPEGQQIIEKAGALRVY